MDRFKRLNPKAVLLFYLLNIIAVITVFHPVSLAFSLAGGCIYKIITDGKRGVKYIVFFIFPVMLLTCVFNFIFTHYGADVIFTAFDTAFTVQSLLYGFVQGMMLGGVILWLSLYSSSVSSEGFLSVFGRLAPNTALIISLALSFIPRMKINAREIAHARALLDADKSRFKKAVSVFSALVTLTLEQSIDTADTMRARGYNKNKSFYTKYRFSLRDGIVCAAAVISFAAVMISKYSGEFKFVYDPITDCGVPSAPALIFYAALSFMPIAVDAAEGIKWSYLKRKI